MSGPHKPNAQQGFLKHYEKLCAAHGTRPNEAQVARIKLAVDPVSHFVRARGFQYALLYFVPKSALVFEQDTLLLGWIHQANGSRAKLWFRHDGIKTQVSLTKGAPEGSTCRINRNQPLCDQWHPSIGTVFEPWLGGGRSTRGILYAYLAATIKLTINNHQRTSFEDYVRTADDEEIVEDDTSAVTTSRSTKGTANRRKRLHAQRVVESEQSSDDDMTVLRSPLQSAPRVRLSVPAEQTHVVDLTKSDCEEDVKTESCAAPPLTLHNETRSNATAEDKIQELRRKMQSRTVAEINSVLAEKSGLLPSWIEDLIRGELEKKMLRDLQTVENLF
ncbi:hypothetical protein KCU92_g3302, partial [Aureobasidium melanogenum]|jgi:hypothetical protein